MFEAWVTRNVRIRKAAFPVLVLLSFIAGAGIGVRAGNDPHPDVAASRWAFDFGKVAQEATVEHTFTLTNKSSRLLELADIQTSCSCTVAVPSGKTMRPGESIRLQVRLDTSHRIGPTAGTCQLEFSDHVTKPVRLEVRANIFSPTARFSHDRVYFPEIVHGDAATRVVTVTNEDFENAIWRITGVSSSSPLISAKYRPASRDILCEVSGKTPVGPLREKIFVETESPTGPSRIAIPVLAEVVETIRPTPKRLYLGTLAPRQVHRCQVSITGAASHRINVPKATEHVSICQHPFESSRFDVEITAPETAGSFAGEIKFPTDLDSLPFVTVHYGGIVRP